jgi:hypothetical protein
MPMISLDDANDLAAQSDFWAIRGKAIHAYAGLEQGLAQLFSALAGVTPKTGGIIFFRISAAIRRTIIEELFRAKFKDEYNLFRNSLFKQLPALDTERNQIVHWNVVNNVGTDENNRTTSNLTLKSPAYWSDPSGRAKDVQQMVDFSKKCAFYASLCSFFPVITIDGYTEHPVSDQDKKPWLEIYSQPVEYPPAPGHFLAHFAN